MKFPAFLLLAACLATAANGHSHDTENPLLEVAKQLLENSLNKDGGQGAAALVQGLAGMFGQPKEGGQGAASLLGGLGNLLAATQGGGGGQADLLASLADVFAQQAGGGAEDNTVDGHEQEQPGFDWESMIGVASSFMAQQSGGNNQATEGLLTLLPLFMGGGQNGQPGGFEKIWSTVTHAWEHFRQSDVAASLWRQSGLSKVADRFMDQEGRFDVHRVFESMSNHQFRRTWIRSLTSFFAEWLAHIADPKSQSRYASIARNLIDGAMRSHGLATFDPTRPGHSLAALSNALLRRHFSSSMDTTPYVKPGVEYVWQLLQVGRTTSEGLGLAKIPPKQIEARMAEALNGEIIEPVLRVWRAYRFAHDNSKCGRYVLCQAAKEAREMPGVGLKPGVTKVASLVATWYLADDAHTSFWQLYAAANASKDCEDVFFKGCDEFLVVDKRATVKKYVHNEL
ncbi:uncharacterized protein LOC135945369 [Cloeon dipterum]|uniref:uncharacterized protein LOC135945369 n=1 Tax=Cloeon dipterum TaxID=197152 RepID=UPI0032205F30